MTLQRVNKMIDQEYTGALNARFSTIEDKVTKLEETKHQYEGKLEWRYNAVTNALELVVL